MIYKCIEKNKKEYGLNWLLKVCKVNKNSYYHFLKKHKNEHSDNKKEKIKEKILEIYHKHNGVPGYRMVRTYLEKEGYHISPLTTYRYMKELNIRSIVRKEKPKYVKCIPNKIFNNLINRNFTADEKNQKWCMDFTYLYLSDGSKRYNCSIIDLYDRSVVASITDKSMTAYLAIRTIEKAIKRQESIDLTKLMIHSDQGSQYTSKEFIDYCASKGITQSMSKAGCPYDNAPIERYFNTLKNELIYLYVYDTEEELYKAIENFAYIHYNSIRPHSYNNYKTPLQIRYDL